VLPVMLAGSARAEVPAEFRQILDTYAKALDAIHALYRPTLEAGTLDWLGQRYAFYDAFSAPGRRLFWDQVDTALFSKGVDAWWMDATEPDLVQPSPPAL